MTEFAGHGVGAEVDPPFRWGLRRKVEGVLDAAPAAFRELGHVIPHVSVVAVVAVVGRFDFAFRGAWLPFDGLPKGRPGSSLI